MLRFPKFQFFTSPIRSYQFVVVDVETSGYAGDRDALLEIAAVRIKGGRVTKTFDTLVKGARVINPFARRLHGIDLDMLEGAPYIEDIRQEFLDFIKGHIIVGHNIAFDVGFLRRHLDWHDEVRCIDTIRLSRVLFPTERKHNLKIVAERLEIENDKYHRALADAVVTAKVFLACLKLGKKKFKKLDDFMTIDPEGNVNYKKGRI